MAICTLLDDIVEFLPVAIRAVSSGKVPAVISGSSNKSVVHNRYKIEPSTLFCATPAFTLMSLEYSLFCFIFNVRSEMFEAKIATFA